MSINLYFLSWRTVLPTMILFSPPGTYQGNYQQNGRRIQEVLTFAAAQGIPVAGEPFELYEIDNRYTIREHEFLTEIQIQVLK